MVVIYSLYAMFVTWMAWRDSGFIKADKAWKINHAKNGLSHIVTGLIVAYFFGWLHFFGILLMTRIVFDVTLNLFRHFNPFRVSPRPKSIIDRIEKKIFGNNGMLPKIIYTILLFMIWYVG